MTLRNDIDHVKLKEIGESLKTLDREKLQEKESLEKEYKTKIKSLLEDNQKKYEETIQRETKDSLEKQNILRDTFFKETIPNRSKNQNPLTLMKNFQEKLQALDTALISKKENLQKTFVQENAVIKESCKKELDLQLESLATVHEEKTDLLKTQYTKLIFDEKTSTKYEKYQADFQIKRREQLNTLDKIILQYAKNLTEKEPDNILSVYQGIDILIYHTINILGKNDLMIQFHKLKTDLLFRFAHFVNYDLDKAEQLSNFIIAELSAQLMARGEKNISFETIAKKVETLLNLKPEDNQFASVLFNIKFACSDFSKKSEYLYTQLYFAKKQEFGNYLSETVSERLLDQDKAKNVIQLQLLQHLNKEIDPKSYYLTHVRLAIAEQKAKRENRLSDFKVEQQRELHRLKETFDQAYIRFFTLNDINPSAIAMIDHAEVQSQFFQLITKGYITNNKSSPFLDEPLTTQEVLNALEKEESITRSALDALAVTEPLPNNPILETESYAEKKIESLLNAINTKDFKLFKLRLVSANLRDLELLKQKVPSTPETDPYLKAIQAREHRLFKLFKPEANSDNTMSAAIRLSARI